MFCSRCGAEISDNNAKFCKRCGWPISNNAGIVKKSKWKGIKILILLLALVILFGGIGLGILLGQKTTGVETGKGTEERGVSEPMGEKQILLPLRKNGKLQCIDREGNVILDNLDYDVLLPFQDGEISIAFNWEETENGRVAKDPCFIDKNGEMDIAFPEGVRPFENGIRMAYSDLLPNSGKLVPVEDIVTGKRGFINMNGEIKVPCIYDSVSYFEAGSDIAIIVLDDKEGLVNEEGEIVVEPQYDVIERGAGIGELICVKKDGKYGYITKSGETAIPLIYDAAGTFGQDGKVVLVTQNEELCLVDEQGTVVKRGMPENYSYGSFSKTGLAPFRDIESEHFEGYANTQGELQISLNYGAEKEVTSAYGFIDDRGLIAGLDDEYNDWYAVIDTEGNEILSPVLCSYMNIWQEDNVIAVYDDEMDVPIGYADYSGDWIVEP